MCVLIAFDKFKNTLTATETCAAAALRGRHPDWMLDLCPLTDGGEFFCETLTRAARAELRPHGVSGPRGPAGLGPVGLVPAENVPAAGGIAFGLMVAAGAQLVPGFDLVSDWLDLPARLDAADLVLAGEGRFDAPSLGGKGPGSLVAEARRRGKTVHVFAGRLGVGTDPEFHAITPPELPLAAALPRTVDLRAAAIVRTL